MIHYADFEQGTSEEKNPTAREMCEAQWKLLLANGERFEALASRAGQVGMKIRPEENPLSPSMLYRIRTKIRQRDTEAWRSVISGGVEPDPSPAPGVETFLVVVKALDSVLIAVRPEEHDRVEIEVQTGGWVTAIKIDLRKPEPQHL